MRNNSLAFLTALVVLVTCAVIRGHAGALSGPHGQLAETAEPYVQVTSVTIEPSTIHKAQQPYVATIIVQIMLRGEAPPDSTARVDVGTYFTDPPGNKVSYDNQSRTITLKEKLTSAKFSAQSTPQTAAGKVVVAAVVSKTTKGVNIKEPDDPKNYRAELVVSDP